MVNSRRKGKQGETMFRKLLGERDYTIYPRPRGESGDDFTVHDKFDRVWSVEVKNTTIITKSHYEQCKRNAMGCNRMLAWHPSGWGFPKDAFVVFTWTKSGTVDVRLWRGRGK